MQFNVVPRTGALAINRKNRGKRGVQWHNSHNQLAGLDRVESPDRAETPHLWEEGAEPGPEYEDNQDL